MSACSNCFRFPNFEILILKYLKICCMSSFRRPECEILLAVRLFETHCKSSIFVLLACLLLQEDKAPTHSYYILFTTVHAHDCHAWLSDCKREFVKPLEWLFGLFRLPGGLSRKTALARDGRDTARHGTASAWQGHGMVCVN